MRQLLGKTRFWILMFLVLLLVAGLAAMMINGATVDSTTAAIYQDGELIETIDLSVITGQETITIDSPNGGTNTIALEHGRICVQEASCPDHLCIQQGWISDGVYPIVCLPNKLVIRIVS